MKNAKKQSKSQLSKLSKEMEKKNKEHEERIKVIVNENIFPLLKEVSTDSEDAEAMCGALKGAIQASLMNKALELTVKELKLDEMLKGMDSKEWERYNRILKSMENEKIATSYKILEGIIGEIALRKRVFLRKHSLAALYEEVKE